MKQYRKKFIPPPPELLKKIRDAIPKHCFERSLVKSFYFVVHDLVLVAILSYFAFHIDTTFASINPLIPYLAWPVYWLCQGAVMVGLWIIAHECGHRAFSNFAWIDNTVGFILHSSLLLPYFSWKYSHSNHHKMTSHMENDSVFIPYLRSEMDLPPMTPKDIDDHGDDEPFLETIPIMYLKSIFEMLIFGWPAYLLFNLSGIKYPGKWVSHFRPDAAIFRNSEYWDIVKSDAGILTTLATVCFFAYHYGITQVAKFYLIPYFMVNFWLVIITYLQHTDEKVPHYRENEFTFVRGAIATVDRDYGILNYIFHN
ncbi:Delta(12)-fatty-acid desaturase, partial [Nowakowskiella sp. JEL0078]